jgi:hypothetical protein
MSIHKPHAFKNISLSNDELSFNLVFVNVSAVCLRSERLGICLITLAWLINSCLVMIMVSCFVDVVIIIAGYLSMSTINFRQKEAQYNTLLEARTIWALSGQHLEALFGGIVSQCIIHYTY